MMHAGTTLAAEVRGNLQGIDSLRPTEIPAPTSGARRLFYWQVPNGAIDVRRPHITPERDIALIMTGPSIQEANLPVRLPVSGGRCQPNTTVVGVNNSLRIDNSDWIAHEFYAVRPGQEEPIPNFAAELTATRSQRQAQIAEAGTYELRDRLAPMFRCWIVVGPGQGRVITPNTDGEYKFPDQPMGDGAYTIRAYFEGKQLGTDASVQVTGGRPAGPVNINVSGSAPASGTPGTPNTPGTPTPGQPGQPATPPPDNRHRRHHR